MPVKQNGAKYRKTHLHRLLALWLCLGIFVQHGNAQTIELVENKGQWPTEVLYKGQMPFGAFFLQPNGYKMVLHNTDDLANIREALTGHEHAADHNHANKKVGLPDDPKKWVLRGHVYEVNMLNASPNAKVLPEKKLAKYHNYFLGSDTTKWKANCGVFQAVVYQNVYPNIDVRYYTQAGQLKYDFILNPGANINDIQLKFDGANVSVKKDQLVIETSVGNVLEQKPYSYQPSANGRVTIPVKFKVTQNIVSFSAQEYNNKEILVIDPSLVFSAFSGSRSDNWGYTATYDGFGNAYGGGIVFGSGYIRRNGIAPNTFAGGDNSTGEGAGFDMGITKWTPNASAQLFSTYIGGNGNEQPHSMVVDGNNSLIVVGRTTSTNFPTTQAIYGPGGSQDITVSKISQSGNVLQASRLLGGTGEDGVNIRAKLQGTRGNESIRRNYGDDARSEVIADANNNIIIASCTRSTNFSTTANAVQTTLSGNQDGVLVVLSPNMSTVVLSTLFGGTGDDACFVAAISPIDQSLYVGGSTTSSSLPGVTNATVISSTNFGGLTDGYVAKFTASYVLDRTTFIGSAATDMLYGVQVDKFGNPYIMGTTTATAAAWPVFLSPFNNGGNQSGGNQFIAKLTPALNAFQYRTRFGKAQGSADISPIAFLVDRCENVYVSGWGGSVNTNYSSVGTNGLSLVNQVNPGFLGDGDDFYIFVLERNALSQLYGGLYGNLGGIGDHVDGGTSRFDRQGVIYQAVCSCAGGGGSGFPSSPGTESQSNGMIGVADGSSQCNLAVFKIALELAGVGAGIRSSISGVVKDTSGCLPLTVSFSDTVAVARQWRWNFGDGTPEETTTVPNTSHTFTTEGTFRVRLIAIDSTTCNIADTVFMNIRVRADEASLGFTATKLDPCDSLRYRFENTSVPPTGKPFRPNSFVWDFDDGTRIPAGTQTIIHSFRQAGTYNVRLVLIDTNYCNAPDSVAQVLRVSTTVKASFITPPSGCAPYTIPLQNNSAGGQRFIWFFGNGDSAVGSTPTYTYTAAGTYTIRLVAIDSNTCNITDDTTFTINVGLDPTAIFTFSPNPPEENTATIFTNLSLGGDRYLWTFGDGDSLQTIRRDTLVQHTYEATGQFRACLRATTNFGCLSDTCATISAVIRPLLSVTSAFSPNGDGVNDLARVRGFGITRMTWQIFNRWGTKVFVTNDPNQGWNGRFNGELQPQEVYNYTLVATFSDGTSTTKTGNITLLR
ncbi:MAG: PKD domain-containing protein [Bacteroidetes bacterium]|nr:MAG: PKD domain-containing protein [Bacteroidota bacterium]